MKRVLIVPLSCVVAACATPVADPEQTLPVQAAQPAPASEPAATQSAAPEQQQSTVQALDPAEGMMAGNEPASDFEGIEELESPGVDQVPPAMIPGRAAPETSVVCERVFPTGSILPTKVCRDKSEIAKKTEADREIFDDIKRNTALGNSRL